MQGFPSSFSHSLFLSLHFSLGNNSTRAQRRRAASCRFPFCSPCQHRPSRLEAQPRPAARSHMLIMEVFFDVKVHVHPKLIKCEPTVVSFRFERIPKRTWPDVMTIRPLAFSWLSAMMLPLEKQSVLLLSISCPYARHTS